MTEETNNIYSFYQKVIADSEFDINEGQGTEFDFTVPYKYLHESQQNGSGYYNSTSGDTAWTAIMVDDSLLGMVFGTDNSDSIDNACICC